MYGLAACIYPVCLALTHDMLSPAQVVPASRAMLLVNGIGAVAGPVVGGFAISLMGPSGLMLFLAAALGVLVALGLHSLAVERAPPVAEQSHCVAVAPGSTAIITALDPKQAP
jgi:MFS family permease